MHLPTLTKTYPNALGGSHARTAVDCIVPITHEHLGAALITYPRSIAAGSAAAAIATDAESV